GVRGGAAGRVGAGRGGRCGRPGGRHHPVPDRHPALLPLSAEPMPQRDPEPDLDGEDYAGDGPEPGYSRDGGYRPEAGYSRDGGYRRGGGYGQGPGPDPDQRSAGAPEPADGEDDGYPDPAELAWEREQAAEPGAERIEEDAERIGENAELIEENVERI